MISDQVHREIERVLLLADPLLARGHPGRNGPGARSTALEPGEVGSDPGGAETSDA